MKITKKKPLRPRGRTDEKRQSAKDAIRDAYANGPQREVQIIPAKRDLETGQPQKKLRVCAYCRVSTDEDTQASSYCLKIEELQREGHGYKKIATMLDLPLNTVKSYIRRHPVTTTSTASVTGCLNCGAPLLQKPGKKEKKFCSDRCRMAWWNAHPERVNRKAFYVATCAHCGQEFQSYGNKGRKYCSRLCFNQARRKGEQG